MNLVIAIQTRFVNVLCAERCERPEEGDIHSTLTFNEPSLRR